MPWKSTGRLVPLVSMGIVLEVNWALVPLVGFALEVNGALVPLVSTGIALEVNRVFCSFSVSGYCP